MTDRREFLHTGVAVSSALPLTINGLLSPAAASARSEDHVAVHTAIFDDRYVEGRALAEAFGRFGIPARALDNGDVTDFWYRELDPLWHRQPAAIAGLTQFGPMFVLERLANERGMRVAVRVEHQAHSDGTLTHAMTGAPDTLALARRLQRDVADWPLLMAIVLAHCRTDCRAPLSRTTETAGPRPRLTPARASTGSESVPESVIHYYSTQAMQAGRPVPWDGPLYSWVIAPVPRG